MHQEILEEKKRENEAAIREHIRRQEEHQIPHSKEKST
jgi:hypothetical protein